MERKQSQKSEVIYALLRHAIVRRDMAPGQVVSEKDLCNELNVSRTPVREAIRRLADEDLVIVYPHSGTYVSEVSYQIAEEGYVIRRSLEIAAVRGAASRITDEQVGKLWQLIDEMRRVLVDGQLSEYIEVDDIFHRTIAEFSGYTRIWKFIDLAKVHLDRLRQMTAPVPGHLEEVTDQHEAIVRAIEKRSPDQAELAMKIHLENSFHVEKVVFENSRRLNSE